MKPNKLLSCFLIFLVSFTILFGAYQLFVDEVEAGIFDCGDSRNCGGGVETCGGYLDCDCIGGPLYYCWPGEPES
jgi:hypothetical protein